MTAEESSESVAAAAAAAVGEVAGADVTEVAAADVEEEDDEPTISGATVQILTEENFERVTQVSTGATTGDWFIGELK